MCSIKKDLLKKKKKTGMCWCIVVQWYKSQFLTRVQNPSMSTCMISLQCSVDCGMEVRHVSKRGLCYLNMCHLYQCLLLTRKGSIMHIHALVYDDLSKDLYHMLQNNFNLNRSTVRILFTFVFLYLLSHISLTSR